MRKQTAAASVEICWVIEGECSCRAPEAPYYLGGPRNCRHWLECDWGRIENPEADPRRGIGHLILASPAYFALLLSGGPLARPHGATHSATRDGARRFIHVEHEGQRWTWELFEAHWSHRRDITGTLIGKWPD